MARRHRPPSLEAWFVRLLGVLVVALIGYQVRLMIIEGYTERQLARTQEATQRLQQRYASVASQSQPTPLQQDPKRQVNQPTATELQQRERQQQREQTNREMEALRQRMAQEQQKAEAWERFYQAPKDCDVWRSDQHMVECQNRIIRAKREFERRWAAEEFSQPSA